MLLSRSAVADHVKWKESGPKLKLTGAKLNTRADELMIRRGTKGNSPNKYTAG